MNGEMVEPDRTIMIISIIGLVVIWGSFFYHKFVQGGGARVNEADISDGDEQNSEHEKPAKKGKNKKGKR
jgi:membrane-anchored glycerophosphoryl diester phosphodiesterase (GDPDase)